jgi:hypothetical protein
MTKFLLQRKSGASIMFTELLLPKKVKMVNLPDRLKEIDFSMLNAMDGLLKLQMDGETKSRLTLDFS